jgi:predicted secreted acid phosphatase
MGTKAVRRVIGATTLVVLLLAGCATGARTPANLYPLKQQIRDYVVRGQYQRELDAIAAQANAWVEERAARGGSRLAVVFDLDETLLFNWPHIIEMDFGYVPREWDRWVEEARAPAIESVREVYRTARKHGVEVIFITGRSEKSRQHTERNLRAIDCADHAALFCKPDDENGLSAVFKTRIRQKLTSEGSTIIANIGDQESDLSGGFSERVFKLPNVFYLTY